MSTNDPQTTENSTNTTTSGPGPSMGMGRRRFLAATAGAAGAGAVGTIAPGVNSPIGRARAVVPAGPIIAAGAVSVAYYAAAESDLFASDDDFEDAAEFERHLQIYNSAREIWEVEDDVLLGSIERDAENLKDKAREQAIIDIYNVVVEGGDKTAAQEAAENAINNAFAAPEKDLATRVNSLVNGIIIEAWDGGDGFLSVRNTDTAEVQTVNTGQEMSFQGEGYTFLDGTASQVDAAHYTGGNDDSWVQFNPFDVSTEDSHYNNGGDTGFEQLLIEEPVPDDYGLDEEDYEDLDMQYVDGYQTLVDHSDYADVLEAIYDAHQAVLDETDTLIQTHFEGIEAGDISVQDMMSPEAMDETIANADGYEEMSLYFYQMGLSEAESATLVSINTEDYDEIERDSVVLEGIIGWSIPTEVEDSELPIGPEINPAAYPGDFRMAAEWEGEDGEQQVEMVTLTSPFSIDQADTSDNYLQFEQRDVVTSDTDPDEAKEVFTTHREVEETTHERTLGSGGGGGGFLPGDGDAGLAALGAIGALLAAILLGGD